MENTIVQESTEEQTFVERVSNLDSSREGEVERKEIENSPFTAIRIGDECFGSMGKYRITEVYESIEEVEKELEVITWNRIVQVVILMIETKKENEN